VTRKLTFVGVRRSGRILLLALRSLHAIDWSNEAYRCVCNLMQWNLADNVWPALFLAAQLVGFIVSALDALVHAYRIARKITDENDRSK